MRYAICDMRYAICDMRYAIKFYYSLRQSIKKNPPGYELAGGAKSTAE